MQCPPADAGNEMEGKEMTKKFAEIEKEILADPQRRAEIEREQDAMRTAVRLGELRTLRETTQVQLAEMLGVSQANVSRIERGDNIYLRTLADYAAALGGRLEINVVFEDDVVPLGLVEQREQTGA
jgi:DNA-binding Xre family transcriptional regulator